MSKTIEHLGYDQLHQCRYVLLCSKARQAKKSEDQYTFQYIFILLYEQVYDCFYFCYHIIWIFPQYSHRSPHFFFCQITLILFVFQSSFIVRPVSIFFLRPPVCSLLLSAINLLKHHSLPLFQRTIIDLLASVFDFVR